MRFLLYIASLLSVPAIFINGCRRDKSPSNSNFQIEKGFEISLVAKEPLVADPVDLEFDALGNAYVLQMPGYPLEDAESKIIRLIDNDKDGVYDDSKMFAQDLLMATSLLSYKQGFLVAAPPYLFFIKDMDGDGTVDIRDTLMGGFSTGNLQHNYNGLTYGLDGWIYAANGGNSGAPFWWPDSASGMRLRGNDIRFNIDQKKLERIGRSSGGFGMTIDEYGRLFETHNLDHISHLVFPSRYIDSAHLTIAHTLLNISDHDENGLARIYPIGPQESRVNHPEQSGYFSGSCGIAYNGGNNLGDDYSNTVWVCDVVLNLLHLDKIIKNGAALSADRLLEKRDFLASSDRSHRPVNLTLGPDGSMYLVDMYRKVIEHPEWIPDDLESEMDLNAGKDKGRIYKIFRTNKKPREYSFTNSTENLIQSLSNQNQWIRTTAHRLLNEKELDKASIESLGKKVSSENSYARLHAGWILSYQKVLEKSDLIKLLIDDEAGIKENALIIAESYLDDSSIISKCISLLVDKDQRVRMQAALSLSRLPKALYDSNFERITKSMESALDLPMDQWNIAAYTLACKYNPLNVFSSILNGNYQSKKDLLISLATLASGNMQYSKTILELVNQKLKNDPALANLIIQSLITHIDPAFGKSLSPVIQLIESNSNRTTVQSINDLRIKLKLPSSEKFQSLAREALKDLQADNLSDTSIIENIKLIAALPFSKTSSILFKYLDTKRSMKIQDAVLVVMAGSKDAKTGSAIVDQWATLGPQARSKAGDILLYNKAYQADLLTGLETKKINIGEMNFDLERRRTLLWWSDNEDIKRRAAALFKDSGVETRKEALTKTKPALSQKGDLQNGTLVFTRVCAPCHIYGNIGNEVGPVLTEISRKSKETLLQDIIDPNAAANTQYITHKIETKKNETHVGIIANESDHEIILKKMGGTVVTVSKSEIKSFTSLGISLMMEGLENSMTNQEIADLLEYLQSNR